MNMPNNSTVDTVEKLLAERQKIARWMAALAAKQAETPPAVYEKVYNDYAAKLEKVQGKLHAASDSVLAAASELTARLTEKEVAYTEKRDERAEAELRFTVGEYSEKEWDKRRTRLDDELAVCAGERDALAGELQRLQEVLDEVAGKERATRLSAPEGVAESAASGWGEPRVESASASAAAPVAAPRIPIHEQTAARPAAAAPDAAPSFDDLEFLRPSAPSAAKAAPVMLPVKGAKEVAPVAAAPKAAPAPKPSVPAPKAPAKSAPAPVSVAKTAAPPAAAPRGDAIGYTAPRSTEAVKSLSCHECGTLNAPTEWYCEKCGGELAAL